jgi:hypothetical protein
VITNVKPMSVDHARALAMACELHRLLGELFDRPEHGPGSCVEDAWNHMDDVIALLEPPDLDERPTLRSLRLAEARR